VALDLDFFLVRDFDSAARFSAPVLLPRGRFAPRAAEAIRTMNSMGTMAGKLRNIGLLGRYLRRSIRCALRLGLPART